ncbi:transcription elongation complex subunit [Pseudovirgaria hyperparasitica]|uniref:FACT complex subunit n=1 Tax=Pseudovirgaria hyperparasitica TaxID=470096 RepID=A0A6A6W622_9PEZI|nr:transcription elongation complex subunit [Pseudovirgaria hyperparasitica]KAF2757400.1 transcription elongation complex subunit [Pseudovirgaria hyperparasitica]
MAEEITIDKTIFHDRLSSFLTEWKGDKRDASFNGVNSIILLLGKASGDPNNYNKAAAFQLWLLGYEFPATLMVLTPDVVHIVTTKKKASYLEPLKGGAVHLEIHIRGKDADENAKQFQQITDIIKGAGKKVGILTKDNQVGPFADEWKKSYEAVSKGLEEVDIATTISIAALSVKDGEELRTMRDAARASSGLMQNFFVDEMSTILDDGKRVTHKALADKVAGKIDDTAFFNKLKKETKMSANFDSANLDWGLPPTIQSGDKFDVKFASEPDSNPIKAGVVILALGLRYSSYGSQVARTYMVDPSKSQETNYRLLYSIHQEVIKALRDNVPTKEVYNKAIGLLRAKKPDLEKHFPKNVGYGIGIEGKDNTLLLSGKNGRTLKDGMTLLVTTSFDNIPNPDGKGKSSYSLVLTDTVRVTKDATAVFTKDAVAEVEEISYFFNESEEEEKPKKAKKDNKVGAVARQNIQKTRLRAERTTNQDAEKEAARREHQKELHQKKQKEGLEVYGKGTGALNGTEEKKFKRFESYKQHNQFPSRVKDLVIVVDTKNSTVILPIMGRPVPFHINTIKNATHSPEGDFTSLRINFLSPGQGVGRKDDQPFEDPTAHFVRSLTFRSRDIERIDDITRQITELKRDIVRRENEKKQMEDVVEQDKLIVLKNRKPYNLDLVYLRPQLEGKRMPGLLEIQQNGLRYHHGMGGGPKVDILFGNIKHLFFQPCQHELIVIIHVHLKNPIMVGKKKTKDVQFYREATDMAFDETGNRRRKHRYGDDEEFEAEQEERRRRAELDKQFKSFAEKIADAGRSENVSVDVPFRELGYNGVPARSSVLIQPTTDCLVQLTEPPFLVLTLSEIEVVHLERVQFGLKNFDMVLIFRDFNRPPAHINTIPVESLDAVKDWLDSCEIPFSEGPLNLNWAPIMKTVTSDPHAFFEDGGWSFLQAESDDEGDESEEQESDFEMDESDLASVSESDDESDFDENASAEASDASDMSDEEEGEDWDDMERKAAKADKERVPEDDDDRKKSAKGGQKRKR